MGPEPLEARQAREARSHALRVTVATPTQELELIGPRAAAAGGPVVVPSHCAECCTDPACPSCWLEGATVELELVPLPRR